MSFDDLHPMGGCGGALGPTGQRAPSHHVHGALSNSEHSFSLSHAWWSPVQAPSHSPRPMPNSAPGARFYLRGSTSPHMARGGRASGGAASGVRWRTTGYYHELGFEGVDEGLVERTAQLYGQHTPFWPGTWMRCAWGDGRSLRARGCWWFCHRRWGAAHSCGGDASTLK